MQISAQNNVQRIRDVYGKGVCFEICGHSDRLERLEVNFAAQINLAAVQLSFDPFNYDGLGRDLNLAVHIVQLLQKTGNCHAHVFQFDVRTEIRF